MLQLYLFLGEIMSFKPPTHGLSNKAALSDDESSKPNNAQDATTHAGQLTNPLANSRSGNKNQLSLMMYVIGGRLGQVTVFNGPISIWKLDLTKTF